MTGKQYSRASVLLVFRSRWLPSLRVEQLISDTGNVLIITAASILDFRPNGSSQNAGLILISTIGLSIYILELYNHRRIMVDPLTPILNPFKNLHTQTGAAVRNRTFTRNFSR